MRALKRRLTALGDASAEPGIASKLIELARCDEAISARALPWAAPTGIAQARRNADWGSGVLPRAWRLAAASAGASLITIGVLAFMLGNGDTHPPVPKITPSVDSYLMQHAFDAGQAPGSTPVASDSPATPGSSLGVDAGHAGLGRPASGKVGHSLARPVRHRTTGASGTAAAQTRGRAEASPSASPSPSSSARVSAGPPVTGRYRG